MDLIIALVSTVTRLRQRMDVQYRYVQYVSSIACPMRSPDRAKELAKVLLARSSRELHCTIYGILFVEFANCMRLQ